LCSGCLNWAWLSGSLAVFGIGKGGQAVINMFMLV